MTASDAARADQPLASHLERLQDFLRPSGLHWKRLALVDEPLPGPATALDAVAVTPEVFEPLWGRIIAAGTGTGST